MREGAEMDELGLGPSYAKIGEIAADLVQPISDGILVYVEIQRGVIGTSVFAEDGQKVSYFSPSRALNKHICEIWKLIPRKKRWATMTYTVEAGEFRAYFLYPDEVDVGDFDLERREEAIRSVFGDKPVAYPQPEDDERDWLIKGSNFNDAA